MGLFENVSNGLEVYILKCVQILPQVLFYLLLWVRFYYIIAFALHCYYRKDPLPCTSSRRPNRIGLGEHKHQYTILRLTL